MLAVSVLGGCALDHPRQSLKKFLTEGVPVPSETAQGEEDSNTQPSGPQSQDTGLKLEVTDYQNEFYAGRRPALIGTAMKSEAARVIPQAASYTVAPDLGNVDNLWQFWSFQQGGELVDKFVQNGFVVYGSAGSEFFEIYETNRYGMEPNFVTVDSLMHTYHLYFAHLLKNVEKKYLSDNVLMLSRKMLDDSISQYEQLKGSEWEGAAKRNVAFFTVGAKLLDDSTAVKGDVKEIVQGELDRIHAAEGVAECGITGDFEDYTQYIPRGYYEGDEKLERYFRAMMWYGRIHFKQENEDMDRSAFLITKALGDDVQAYSLWKSIYAVTSFFAGASDDLGVCEYAPIIFTAYGEDISVSSLPGKDDAFKAFHDMTSELRAPQINSIPIMDGESNVIQGFRFMGQRFTIDAAVMQNLIYQRVGENSAGQKRMLPDTLDVTAALGSDTALDILKENGAMEYAGYTEKMEKLRSVLSQENETLWSASLYAGWLNTLRPLLEVKGEGYPVFMQNREWLKKDLECFAGSYAELKHDTILYAKQVIAEMGGGLEEEPDDRGYVEPEPLVYERFVALADQTAQGLREYSMLDDKDAENMTLLSQIAGQLLTISNKELQDELPTEEEFEFIRSYGGSIEHFWYEIAREELGLDYVAAQELPAAIVADIATNPDAGTVLEVATGNPSAIYVAVRVDGKIKIARGSVYSFYQFEWPSDDRLTDTKWRVMMGLQPDSSGNYNYNNKPVQKPQWTESYRYKDEWE